MADGPCVETDFGFHDGDAGGLLTFDKRPLDRGCPTVFRQQAGMDVQEPRSGDFKEAGRQNLSVGYGHGNIGI